MTREAISTAGGIDMTRLPDLAPVPLRVVMGFAFIVHGYPKLVNLTATMQSFSQQGFVPGAFWAPLVAIVECVGGACLVLGVLTRHWSLALAIEMIVTTLVVKIPRGTPFVARGGGAGYELDLIYLAGALALVAFGSGALAIDRVIGRTGGPLRRVPELPLSLAERRATSPSDIRRGPPRAA
jgi:putative oxidoreductase